MIVYLGNAAVHPAINFDPEQPTVVRPDPPTESVTVIHPGVGSTPVDLLVEVAKLWQSHSTAAPSWIASDDDTIAGLLSAQFGGCPVKTVDDAVAAYSNVTSGGE